ncbi:fungal-specific transcription factor domain-containing protein [Penicillium chermesinum]|uniref:Fungal-specific transcription factor domain-containing protein n=1 Tax=Penicillium chermesinum TaxID=63820 RepID=A0A9W9PJ53_9EURO|nr:fungal-specific transcription factor domain-containing protein [Penicillium chermesinum]KAJ5247801.1 fungal-specific transcription factor domain-containing protein [Penicillium chermesinum]
MSMCLDRPPHVLEGFCEIEMLSEADFESHADSVPGSVGTAREQMFFVIHHALLARTANSPHPWQRSDGGEMSRQDDCLKRISNFLASIPLDVTRSPKGKPWLMLIQLISEYVPEAVHNITPGTPVFELCTRLFRNFEDLMAVGALHSFCGYV